MSLFRNHVEHADNPPKSWVIEHEGRRWFLRTKNGDTLQSYGTKHEAEEAKREGFWVDTYNEESRWYAGEAVRGWRPYADLRGTTAAEVDRRHHADAESMCTVPGCEVCPS